MCVLPATGKANVGVKANSPRRQKRKRADACHLRVRYHLWVLPIRSGPGACTFPSSAPPHITITTAPPPLSFPAASARPATRRVIFFLPNTASGGAPTRGQHRPLDSTARRSSSCGELSCFCTPPGFVSPRRVVSGLLGSGFGIEFVSAGL